MNCDFIKSAGKILIETCIAKLTNNEARQTALDVYLVTPPTLRSINGIGSQVAKLDPNALHFKIAILETSVRYLKFSIDGERARRKPLGGGNIKKRPVAKRSFTDCYTLPLF